MFYKHTHLLFFSLSLFSNSQILRFNKQTQSQQPCPPPHLPQFSQPQTPPPPPPIATPAFRNFLINITESVCNNLAQRCLWFELIDTGRMAWVALDWVAWPRRWSECIFLFLGLGFRFDQFLFWILFLGFLGLWKFEKEEWEKNWV